MVRLWYSAGWQWVAFHPGIFIIRSSSTRRSGQLIRAHIGEHTGWWYIWKSIFVIFYFFPIWWASLLSYRVIFELLWRDYFRFVSVKYGNRIFQVKGTGSWCFYVTCIIIVVVCSKGIFHVTVTSTQDFKTNLCHGKRTWSYLMHGKVCALHSSCMKYSLNWNSTYSIWI